jgi:hypothetical protein
MMHPITRRWYVWVASAVVLIGLVFDLAGPRQSDLRNFDPEMVARLETEMWRSYYDRRQVPLFLQLAELLRAQYGAPFLRSNLIAFHGAKAAFVFKDGQNRKDYERALPDLMRYYSAIHRLSKSAFDLEQAAKLELEWWIIHRERKNHPREDLDRSLAELQAALYTMPAERFLEHGRLRAEAMLLRDDRSEAGPLSEENWAAIHELLRQSWRELWTQLN